MREGKIKRRKVHNMEDHIWEMDTVETNVNI